MWRSRCLFPISPQYYNLNIIPGSHYTPEVMMEKVVDFLQSYRTKLTSLLNNGTTEHPRLKFDHKNLITKILSQKFKSFTIKGHSYKSSLSRIIYEVEVYTHERKLTFRSAEYSIHKPDPGLNLISNGAFNCGRYNENSPLKTLLPNLKCLPFCDDADRVSISNKSSTVLLGGKQKCTVNRGHGKSGEGSHVLYCKHDIGGTQRGTLYRGTRYIGAW